jgi:hypothetical protein
MTGSKASFREIQKMCFQSGILYRYRNTGIRDCKYRYRYQQNFASICRYWERLKMATFNQTYFWEAVPLVNWYLQNYQYCLTLDLRRHARILKLIFVKNSASRTFNFSSCWSFTTRFANTALLVPFLLELLLLLLLLLLLCWESLK